MDFGAITSPASCFLQIFTSHWLDFIYAGFTCMLRTPNCPFVLYFGTKKLVKRKEFEQYISDKLVI